MTERRFKNHNFGASQTIESFGREWKKFDQNHVDAEDELADFGRYFNLVPDGYFSKNCTVFDMGCGTGRWAKYVARDVGWLDCVEPSDAIAVAKEKLQGFNNISFYKTPLETFNLNLGRYDWGYCLGVLHHLDDPKFGFQKCIDLLKPGGLLLVYFYYDFENRPWWFRGIFKVVDVLRRFIVKQDPWLVDLICEIMAVTIYLPLARFCKVLDRLKVYGRHHVPLFEYKDKALYTLRTDARDRFGTAVEHRYSRKDLFLALSQYGLRDITISSDAPYWCAIGYKR